jgi:hypothetical protein
MKMNVEALNECLGIDGPEWIDYETPNPTEFIQVPHFVYSNKGIPHTEETRRKIKEKATGRIMSREAKQKMSKSHMGKSHSGQKQLGKNNHNYQYNWKFTFECGKIITTSSMPTWCKNNGYDKAALMRVCNNQVRRHKDIVTVEKVAQEPSQKGQKTL